MGLLALAAALSLGAAPGGPAPKPATAPAGFAWPTPDLIESADVQGPMTAEGIPLRLRAVRLKHSIDELAPLYVAAYRRAGFYIPPRAHQVDLFRDPALTALDTRHFISYTAIFQENPDKTTTVVLGEANLGLARPPNAPPGLPLFAGAAHLSRATFEGSGVVSYEAPATPKVVRAFYQDKLGKLGFAAGAGPEDGDVFRKGDVELSLNLAAQAHGKTAVVLILKQTAAPSSPSTP
jgi:hypothetical protein